MKYYFLILFLLLYLLSYSQSDLTRIEHFGENEGNLKMYTYTPKSIATLKKTPLIFVLHGCTQSAKQISNETGWNKLADSLNFRVVYPEQRQINNGTKCFNFFVGFKSKKDKGEVASIKQMIDYCFTNYSIDSSMVFITGMSAGGGMSNALLNAYPEIFNAGALIGAPSNLFDINTIPPKSQPRIIILQGNNDKIVSNKNGDELLIQWSKKHEIDSTLTEEQTNYQSNPLLKAQYYYSSANNLKIISLLARDVAHKLIIHPGDKINEGGAMDFHTQDINFHSTYWIASFFGLVNN